MAMGEAAGTAAALAAQQQRSVRKIDIKQLQQQLQHQGAIL
jgi:hypothetical protein